MHLLICNDDGIHAAGITVLAIALRNAGHQVTVSAPDRERSCSGHALTMHEALFAHAVDMAPGINAWAVSGTPADCAKLGISELAQGPVDLVVSGINHGPNLGSDTLYSGTAAAAREAMFMGYPALAVSLGGPGETGFDACARITVAVVDRMQKQGLNGKIMYNLNVPALPEDKILGIRRAKMGMKRYTGGYEKLTSPFGKTHYWLSSWPDKTVTDEPDSDVALLRAGYATLTPLGWSMMDEETYNQMNDME